MPRVAQPVGCGPGAGPGDYRLPPCVGLGHQDPSGVGTGGFFMSYPWTGGRGLGMGWGSPGGFLKLI